jgi:hypothetical protein
MDIVLQGSPTVYSQLQWGEAYPSSLDNVAYREQRIAYDPHRIIPLLWSRVNHTFDTTVWTSEKIIELSNEVSAVVQTFSLDEYVINEIKKYHFPTYTSKVSHGANVCLYNGNPDVEWIRQTTAFGHYSVEYPASWRDRMGEIKAKHDEVTNHDGKVSLLPDIHPLTQAIKQRVYGPHNNILLTGRFTTLNRRALSHHTQREERNFLGEIK